MKNYNPTRQANQLTLPGFYRAPGYPIRGVMRCLAYCVIYGWPSLGALAELQLTKVLEGGAL